MKRYITVDSGKSFTKVDIYDEPSNQIISKNIRTNMMRVYSRTQIQDRIPR